MLRFLTDILDELKQANLSLKEMKGVVKELEGRVGAFEQQLKDQQVIAPPADTEAVKQTVAGGLELFRQEQAACMQRMTAIVEAQPKNVVRQWRRSFFPAEDRVGNYQYFLKKASVVAMVMSLILAAFGFGIYWLERSYASPTAYVQPLPAESAADGPSSRGVTGAGSASPRSPAEKKLLRPHRDRRRPDTLYKKYIRQNSDSLSDSGR